MQSVDKRDKILWINTLKGVCILLVVLHHSIVTTFIPSIPYLSSGSFLAKMWSLFNQSVSPLRMPAFFFVSGLLASNSITKRKWSDVSTKKIGNLMYLYLLWGLIQWIFIKKLISEPLGAQLSDSGNSAYAESITEFISLIYNGMTSLWYLYALAIYFLVAKLCDSKKYILIFSAIALNYMASMGMIEGWGLVSISQNLIFFLFGVYLSGIFISLSDFNKKNIFFWFCLFTLAFINLRIGVGRNIFLCSLAIVMAISISRFVSGKYNLRWLNWLGENTLQIYVIHRVFIEIFGLLVLKLSISNDLFNVTYYTLAWSLFFPLLSVSVCTALSILVWKVVNNGPGKFLFSHPKLLIKNGLKE